jgi:hypothetical protein
LSLKRKPQALDKSFSYKYNCLIKLHQPYRVRGWGLEVRGWGLEVRGWGLEVRGWGLGLQPNNLLLITVDNYNTILLITQGAAEPVNVLYIPKLPV